MKLALQYLSDTSGKTLAVQLPFTDWEKLLNKLSKYEQALQLKSDLIEAYKQATILKNSKGQKQTLKEFLNEI
ncbi:MAG: hypothetical protein EAZ47_06210 [Bacteroidetes bacterium]|nr:MAG: hypothetical protein EAY72_02635 [Bacteroidota bacterium]TAF93548.1 MAG: hypothetical protein EAZ47_06210 [Bacteroidota bacterium]